MAQKLHLFDRFLWQHGLGDKLLRSNDKRRIFRQLRGRQIDRRGRGRGVSSTAVEAPSFEALDLAIHLVGNCIDRGEQVLARLLRAQYLAVRPDSQLGRVAV